MRMRSSRFSNCGVRETDTGVGIAQAHLPRLFDRFYRADPARTRNRGGAGLKLASVESIARLHGGKAEISSRVGLGTRVTLTFASTAVIEKSGPKETHRLGSSDSGVGPGR